MSPNKRLKYFIQGQGLSMAELARKMGVTRSFTANMTSDGVSLNGRFLIRLHEMFPEDLDLHYILTGEKRQTIIYLHDDTRRIGSEPAQRKYS